MRIKAESTLEVINAGAANWSSTAIREAHLVLMVAKVHQFSDVVGRDNIASVNTDEFVPA